MSDQKEKPSDHEWARRRVVGSRRITKDEFRERGGISNPRLWRRRTPTRWVYYEVIE